MHVCSSKSVTSAPLPYDFSRNGYAFDFCAFNAESPVSGGSGGVCLRVLKDEMG